LLLLLLIGKANSAIAAESETNHQSLFYYYKVPIGQAMWLLLLIGKASSAIAAESETNQQSLFYNYKVHTGQARAVRLVAPLLYKPCCCCCY
jgi:hypothetical protein